MPRFSDMMYRGLYRTGMMQPQRRPRLIQNGELSRDVMLYNRFIAPLARSAGVNTRQTEAPPNPSPAGSGTMRYNVGRFPFMQPERINFDLQRKRSGRKPMVSDDYGIFAR